MKRSQIIMVTAIAATVTLAAAGCSSASESAGTPEDPVTISFWGAYGNGGNSAQADVLHETLIPSFERANPGIKVEYVDVPHDDLLKKLTTSAAGDELPDLVRADLSWVPKFADLGVLVPLSVEMENFQELADATFPGVLSTNLYNGEYYGLPLDTNTRVLITSQQALDAQGLDAPPATFDEFVDAADALAGSGMQVFADGGLGAWNISPWIWSGGGAITDEAVTISTGYLDSPESVATVQMLVDLYADGQISTGMTGNAGAISTAEGLPGANYANIFDGPWMEGIWSEQFPEFEPIYAPIPAGDGGSISVVGGEDIVLTSTSQHKEAAMKFIEFTQSEEFQMALVPTGQLTVIKALGEKQVEVLPYLELFTEQLATAQARVAIPKGSEVDTILNDALVPAFEGTVTVKAALSDAAKKIDALLTEK